jgi:uncharacterized protein YdhG (YjbR/CyaY superfamily)
MSATKTTDDVHAYLVQIPDRYRPYLEAIRQIVWSEAPDAEEVIAYGIPTFKLSGNLVHYAAFKNHMSFFPGSTLHNEAFKDELAGFKVAKGTIQFTPGNPLPEDLVRRIVQMRIEENRDAALTKKLKKTRR